MTEIVSAFIGAILGYGFGWYKDYSNRRQLKEAWATALMHEAAMFMRFVHVSSSSYDNLLPSLSNTLHETPQLFVSVLDAKTLHAVLLTREWMITLRNSIDTSTADSDERVSAESYVGVLVDLAEVEIKELQRIGGKLDPPEFLRTIYPQLDDAQYRNRPLGPQLTKAVKKDVGADRS